MSIDGPSGDTLTSHPAPEPEPEPKPRRRRSAMVPVIAVAIAVVVVVAVVASIVRSGPGTSARRAAPAAAASAAPPDLVLPDPSTTAGGALTAPDPVGPTSNPAIPAGDPLGATTTYYGLLAQRQALKAFSYLCAARQQQMGLEGYVHTYTDDVATGTGIHSWTPGKVTVQGDNAAVPGVLVLDDKETVPLTLLVVRESGGWRVCTSDLGGVLPNPGTTSTSPPGSGITT